MKTNIYFLVLITSCFLLSCGNKNEQTSPSPNPVITAKIDVSNQYVIDVSGTPISGNIADSQWRTKNFTTEEMSLFASLDTADLSTTTYPGSITDANFQFIYPNPFFNIFYSYKQMPAGFTGQVVCKVVIVDSMLHPLFKAVAQPTGPSLFLAFSPSLPVGKYRLYYTLSALSHEHFYKSWGNIQEL